MLATVDMAAEELREVGQSVDMASVKTLIRQSPEWTPKLKREIFSDANIARAINETQALFQR